MLARRQFFERCLAGSLYLALPTASGAQQEQNDSPVKVQTYTYKTVGDLEIQADVHRPDDAKIRPVVVWIHGGALINGHRAAVSGRVRSMMLNAGYAIVSIDYRLAPETKLPAIIEDRKMPLPGCINTELACSTPTSTKSP